MRQITVRPKTAKERRAIEKILKKQGIVSYDIICTKDFYKFEILVTDKKSGEIIKELEDIGFGKSFEKGITVLSVQASVPPLRKKEFAPRTSFEEIEEDIKENATTNWIFLGFMSIASIIVTFGLLDNNYIAIIGGMLIAPLLYPIIGSSYFIHTNNNTGLKKTGIAEIWGISMAVFWGIIVSFLIGQVEVGRELLLRGTVTLYDLGIAIFAGAAGALSVMTRKLAGFAGVAIAVAVVPPAATVGIAVGAGDFTLAGNALLLTIINITSIHIVSMLVFSVLRYKKKEPKKELKKEPKTEKKK